MSVSPEVKRFFDLAKSQIVASAKHDAVKVLVGGAMPRDEAESLINLASRLAAARFIEGECLRLLAKKPSDPFAEGIKVAADEALDELNRSFQSFLATLSGPPS